MKIEFLNRANDRTKHQSVNLNAILDYATNVKNITHIKHNLFEKTKAYRDFLINNPNATKKEISNMKLSSFGAVAFAGTFKAYDHITDTGTVKANEIETQTKLMVLDYDHIHDLEATRIILQNEISTFIVFTSPSGTGLKVLVKHNLTDVSKWQYLFEEIKQRYDNITELKADKSGKDISRLCYIPYIDNLYKKENCSAWQYNGTSEYIKVVKSPNVTLAEFNTDNDSLESKYIADFLNKNCIDITNDYNDWISYGYSLASLGEAGREIYHTISSIYNEYSESETDSKFDYMLDNFDNTKNSIENFIYNGKRAIANYMIFKEYGYNCE